MTLTRTLCWGAGLLLVGLIAWALIPQRSSAGDSHSTIDLDLPASPTAIVLPTRVPDIEDPATSSAAKVPVESAPLDRSAGAEYKLVGVVVDCEGNPVEGVKVGTNPQECPPVLTDAHGRFELAPLSRRSRVVVVFSDSLPEGLTLPWWQRRQKKGLSTVGLHLRSMSVLRWAAERNTRSHCVRSICHEPECCAV